MMAATMTMMRIMRLLRLSGDPPVQPLTSSNHPRPRSHSLYNWLRFEPLRHTWLCSSVHNSDEYWDPSCSSTVVDRGSWESRSSVADVAIVHRPPAKHPIIDTLAPRFTFHQGGFGTLRHVVRFECVMLSCTSWAVKLTSCYTGAYWTSLGPIV